MKMQKEVQGWVDLQINGYGGVDFNAPGLTVEAVKAVVRRLAQDGTAAFLPTLVTGDPEMLIANVRTIMAARKADPESARRIIGFFLEGPFISPEPGAVGTHPIEWVRAPDMALFERFQDAAEGMIRLVNVAAEIPGMPDFVRALDTRGVAVTLGHQLAATPEQLAPCLDAGARAFTHLGNGIPNMIPRHHNVIFSALTEARATVMFIPDGHHLPDTVLQLYLNAVPHTRLVAVSDAQYPAGMPPGDYPVCGASARLEPSGLLWNPARNCLVGATTPMAKMMAYLRTRFGLSEASCRAIGRDNPLRLIGLDPRVLDV
jgi:N-acetylglucosamine-6-phosphate deacetylase